MKLSFINEFGNPVTIEVTEQYCQNPNSSDLKSVPGFVTIMNGPTSTHENHVTRAEAEAFHSLLGIFLKRAAVQL